MAGQSVRNTALGAATCRLIEQSQPEKVRLLNDPVVKDLVGTLIRILLRFASMRNYTIKRTDAIMQGIYGGQICRTRFIDDVVQAGLLHGIGQLVILGAGFDTRPYRLADAESVKVLEVDLPSVQGEKKKKILKRFGRFPENVSFVPMDFDTQSLESALAGTAFDPSRPAVFVWEGVSQYLSEEAVRRTLSFVGKSTPGSILVFSYVLKDIVERRSHIPGADKLMDVVAKNNAPWLFGLEPGNVQSFLKPFHLDLTEEVGNADYQIRYLKPLGRSLIVSECERVVQASVIRP
jgi:methyltransferase (TIGR00027 family)